MDKYVNGKIVLMSASEEAARLAEEAVANALPKQAKKVTAEELMFFLENENIITPAMKGRFRP